MKKTISKRNKAQAIKKTFYKKYFLKSLVFFGIVCLFIIGIFAVFLVNPSYVKEPYKPYSSSTSFPSSTPSPTPYPFGNSDVFISSPLVKRNYDPNKQIEGRFQTINVYPPSFNSLLANISDNDLIGIKCAPWIGFYKTTGYTYYLNKEMLTLNDSHILSILDKVNSSVMKDSIISGYFVCQTEDNRIIMNYSSYKYGQSQLDRTYHFMQIDSQSNLESITDIPLNGWSSCNTPLVLTKNNILYYQCDGGDGTSGHYLFYKIDLNNKTNQLLLQCDINTEEATSTCQE